jgi:hypothetical protein
MNRNVVYVGIDVDDVQYHGSALDRQTGEVLIPAAGGSAAAHSVAAAPQRVALQAGVRQQVRQLKNLDEILAAYGVEVEALAASSRYQEPVKALTCFSICKGASRTCSR